MDKIKTCFLDGPVQDIIDLFEPCGGVEMICLQAVCFVQRLKLLYMLTWPEVESKTDTELSAIVMVRLRSSED